MTTDELWNLLRIVSEEAANAVGISEQGFTSSIRHKAKVIDAKTAIQDEFNRLNEQIFILEKVIKQAEWEDGVRCPWCRASYCKDTKHRDDCSVFTPDGEIKL